MPVTRIRFRHETDWYYPSDAGWCMSRATLYGVDCFVLWVFDGVRWRMVPSIFYDGNECAAWAEWVESKVTMGAESNAVSKPLTQDQRDLF